jgi:hypothetical protein
MVQIELFKYKGHKYCSGCIDLNGKIQEVHTPKQFAVVDHHRDFAYSYEWGGKMNIGEAIEFFIVDGKICFDPYDVEENGFKKKQLREYAKLIAEQITIL